MKLEAAIEIMKADSAWLDPALLMSDVGGFSIDSRQITPGAVFFALSQPEYRENGFNGEFADSTAYVPDALTKGALACVVRRERFEQHVGLLDNVRSRLIFVDDVIAALQNLAHGVYLDWSGPVVAITGSAGKTSAKEMTAHVLSEAGKKVLKNARNFNNGLGHPLTVLELANDSSYDLAVLEMGMSTPLHEIQRLCRITPPDISVVLNVLPVHIEHLGTIERIAQAKAEIVQGMKVGGVAVLNADDPRVAAMRDLSRGSVITFGIDGKADVSAEQVIQEDLGAMSFLLTIDGAKSRVDLPMAGRHNVMNALAAAAVGHSFGMSVRAIAKALRSVATPPQRGEVLKFAADFSVINDSYNSNPDALLSMARTLVYSAGTKRKVVVAGEMLELGQDAAEIHKETGRRLGKLGIDVLLGVRGLAKELVKGAQDEGLGNVEFCEDSDVAASRLVEMIAPGDVVLVKGSRGVRTEKVVEKLLQRFELGEVVHSGLSSKVG